MVVRQLVIVALVAAMAAVGLAPAATPASAATDPPLSVPIETLDAALTCATPSFVHPDHEPVLLVHGTFTNPDENWGWNYRVQLPADGYDVCWVALPDRSLNDIQVASEYVVEAVRLMYSRDGQRPIAIVGHSQGALEPRWAVKWWPSIQPMVADLVTLAGPNHGTAVADPEDPTCPACWQMKTTSNFIRALNGTDETPGTISYTAMYSLNDELVQPAAPTPVGRIEGAANILMQAPDVCPGRPVDHVQFAYDKVVYDLVRDAIDHAGPAVPVRAYASSSQPAFCAQTSIADPPAGVALALAEAMNPQNAPPSSFTPAEPPLACYAGGPCP